MALALSVDTVALITGVCRVLYQYLSVLIDDYRRQLGLAKKQLWLLLKRVPRDL